MLKPLIGALRRFSRDERGASMIEYAIVVSLIAIVAIVTIKLLGTNASTLVNSAASSV
jgi:Flp pilus assembly pilin Flp